MVTTGSPDVHLETPRFLRIFREVERAFGERVEFFWVRGPKTDAQLGIKPSKKRRKMKRAFILEAAGKLESLNGRDVICKR